ncbi:MAG TPA: glycosyltransferase family 9 protein [Candidatus Limnocylindria bacterium]|nr:glycosyltransferase family 9 protein [Candidatus Limnocylindria bacterium]
MARRKRAVPAGGFRNIVVLRLSSLGDVVLTLPAVHALRRAFPVARITYWVKEEFADLVRFDPALDHARVLERDARRIEDLVSMSAELEDTDLIVDLHANPRTWVLTFRQRAPILRTPSFRLRRASLVHARWLRPQPPPSALERHAQALARVGVAVEGLPHVHAGDAAETWAEQWLADWTRDAAPIALLPGARHFTKRWPEGHWAELHDRLRRRGHPLLYFSLLTERKALGALVERAERDAGVRWSTETLSRMAALLSRCAAAVSSDSGLMHLAAARGLRVVAMFGSTAPELGFAPAGAGHVVLCRHEPCQPCTLHGRPSCPKRHFRCMIELRPDQVEHALVEVLTGR